MAETNTSINNQSKPMVKALSWIPVPSGKAVPIKMVTAIMSVDVKPYRFFLLKMKLVNANANDKIKTPRIDHFTICGL